MIWQFHAILLPLVFLLGTMVGSFINVCVYRIPWQKSVIWPPSCCPKCLQAIAPQDNLPIVGWLRLRGRCRTCGLGIAARYPLVELLVGLLFVGVYLADMVGSTRIAYSGELSVGLIRTAYHSVLVALLVVATFIDADYTVIPDSVTVPGMLIGLGVPLLEPMARVEPAMATDAWGALKVGLLGLFVGGGVIYAVRVFGGLLFRKEAMGLGDVTLMAMVGSFLGWQISAPALFLAAFLGLGHSLVKVVNRIRKWLTGRKSHAGDHEIPFGPYLSLATLILFFGWKWIWPAWLGPFHRDLGEVAQLFWSLYTS